jgi:hypothetical protein
LFKKLNKVFKSVGLNVTVSHNFGGEEKMTNEKRKMGLYGASGVLVAALIIASVVISGVTIPSLKLPMFMPKTGTLIIKIMDKPVPLKHLNVTIDSLSIQGQDENWTDLELIGGEPVYFDLLELQNVTMTLSETEISTGNYTMIKMHIKTANATYTNGDVIEKLKVPSGYIRVLLKPHLEMKSGGFITVTIDLEPDLSQIAISHSLNLKPVMKALVGSD